MNTKSNVKLSQCLLLIIHIQNKPNKKYSRDTSDMPKVTQLTSFDADSSVALL